MSDYKSYMSYICLIINRIWVIYVWINIDCRRNSGIPSAIQRPPDQVDSWWQNEKGNDDNGNVIEADDDDNDENDDNADGGNKNNNEDNDNTEYEFIFDGYDYISIIMIKTKFWIRSRTIHRFTTWSTVTGTGSCKYK